MRRAKPAPTRSDTEAAAGWRLGPRDAPVVVRGAAEPLAALPLFLHGWTFDAAPVGLAPDIEVLRRGPDEFGVVTHGPAAGAIDASGPLDAANALAGAAIAAYVARDPDLVCLHCGSVRIGGGVVALIGPTGAGKSTLALMLAEAGHRLFGDDRLAVSLPRDGLAPEGIGVGLAPKMRLPLPPGRGDDFAGFIEARAAYWGEDAVYLRPRAGEAAGLGERAPLAAVIVLERVAVGGPTLVPLGAADAVRALLAECFAPHVPAERLVPALERLVRAVAAWRLTFADSAKAAAALAARFGHA